MCGITTVECRLDSAVTQMKHTKLCYVCENHNLVCAILNLCLDGLLKV